MLVHTPSLSLVEEREGEEEEGFESPSDQVRRRRALAAVTDGKRGGGAFVAAQGTLLAPYNGDGGAATVHRCTQPRACICLQEKEIAGR